MSWVAIGVAAVSVGVGIAQKASARKKEKKADAESKRLFGQRKAYQTPKEVLDLVGMAQYNAQTGFSAETKDYLTTQNDRALSGTLGAATRLGADPNQLSSILDMGFQNIFKIGSDNELLKMRKFDQLYNATTTLGQSRDAEWASRENMIKDQMQRQQQIAAAAQVENQSGTNMIVSGLGSAATAGLYASALKTPAGVNDAVVNTATPVTRADVGGSGKGVIQAPTYISASTDVPGYVNTIKPRLKPPGYY